MTKQKAIDLLDNLIGFVEDSQNNDYDGVFKMAIEALSAQPEIIRCKDCKFWTHIKRTKRYWCKTDDGLYDLNTSADDFCSRAERRTDG